MSRPSTPAISVDAIIELTDRKGRPLVLIERKYEPLGWAIPGGFVDLGETVEMAVIREAREETGLNIEITGLLGVYSDPERDPRGHTVSVVFIAQAAGNPVGQDDAARAGVFYPESLPDNLAFDHARILEDYRNYRAKDA